jgi:hypothetical protein
MVAASTAVSCLKQSCRHDGLNALTPEQAAAAVVQQLPSVTAEQINSVGRLDLVFRTTNQGPWTINFADWVELP